MKHQPAGRGPAVPPVVPAITAPTSLERLFGRRAVARTALAILTLGLAALGALGVDATTRTATTSEHIRALAAVSDKWDEFFLHVGVEYEALEDYRRANSVEGRTLLPSAIGGAAGTLEWLATNGTEQDASRARSIAASYDAFTDSLRQVMASRDRGEPEATTVLFAEQAALSASALRKQAVARAAEKRAELNHYLLDVEGVSATSRVATAVIAALDGVLLAACALILLGYQRRAEQQAGDSTFRALHDELTGLPNRSLLMDRLSAALRPTAEGRGVALLLLDLDGFKDINDGLGHPVGDALLQEIAGRLWQFGRADTDVVARLGGDEFAILLTDTSVDGGVATAERVLEVVRRPVRLDGLITQVGGSVGVAGHPDHASTVTELLKSADIAMYDAKRRRAGVAVFSAETNEHTSDRLVMLSQLRRAVEAGEQVVLHYQPKVNTRFGSISGVEALVRWQHPTRGLLPPSEFMTAVERGDLIVPLTDRITTIALHQLARWLADGLVLPLSMNVSAAALVSPEFAERLGEQLTRHAVPPDLVTLEITETAIVADEVNTAQVMARLRKLGVRLSLDDFGTGYSSLSHLTMPLQELKIDQQFVTDMTVSPRSYAIARAVVDVAHALGLRVVAEGVEDEETLTALRKLGCDDVQGFHLCRPLPEGELRSWLQHRLVADPEPLPAAR